MPETVPVVALMASQAGAPLSAKVGAGVPEAANVYEYGVPTTPVSGGVAAVNAGGIDGEETVAVVCTGPGTDPMDTITPTG